MKTVVYLVDQKKRDLPGSVLVKYHLEQLGVKCILEPVQAWGAAVGYHKPDMVILSNLFNDGYVQYSKDLHAVGVKVGILPNEGAVFDAEWQRYRAFEKYPEAFVDRFISWNKLQADLTYENLKATNPDIVCDVTGCPRFDFHFPPLANAREDERPTALICTMFGRAHYFAKDKKEAEDWLEKYVGTISAFDDWWGMIEKDYRYRESFMEAMDEFVGSTDLRLILKPHPNEPSDIYEEWHTKLSSSDQSRVQLEPLRQIDELLSECDVLVTCNTCTTAVEAWMRRIPVMELTFTREVPFYFHELSQWNPQFDDWQAAAAEMSKLANGAAQEEVLWTGRDDHLNAWYGNPTGDCAIKTAKAIAECVQHADPDYSKLPFSYRRRGAKLYGMHKIKKPYGWHPLTPLKDKFMPRKYGNKAKIANRAMTTTEEVFWDGHIRAKFAAQTS